MHPRRTYGSVRWTLKSGGRRGGGFLTKSMSNLKALRAELGHVNELLADARSHEVTAVLAGVPG